MFNCSNPVQTLLKKSASTTNTSLPLSFEETAMSQRLNMTEPDTAIPAMPAPGQGTLTTPNSPTSTYPADMMDPPSMSPMIPSTTPNTSPRNGSNLIPPGILPESPSFTVPANPLLPPGYQEVLDYEGIQYMNGFLRTQIGRNVQVEFLVGSSSLTTRYGRLVGVGINYILLYDEQTRDVVACDFYNIKFVRIDDPNILTPQR